MLDRGTIYRYHREARAQALGAVRRRRVQRGGLRGGCSLPVAPGVKTKSEFATLAFVHEKTNILVPLVIAYDADLTNELGFECMLMERIDARPLHEMWHEIFWLKKGLLVMQTAAFQA
jgi:hypothetical protein